MVLDTDWKTYQIRDLGRVITGKTPSSKHPELFGDRFPFITPTDMDGDKHWVDTARFLSEKGFCKQTNLQLSSGSICFVCIGATIGKMCLTKQVSFTNQQINSLIVDSNLFDNRFVYYLLKTQIEKVKGMAGGAATPIVNKTTFSDMEVNLPPLPTQKKIASILSAYDDLIENNTRRIKILEEMAQTIYREWFVNFRFPGHEKVKMVDSPLGKIPEGWEVCKVSDILSDLESGSRPKGGIDPSQRGVPSIGAENILGLGQYDYSKEKYISSDFYSNMRKGHIQSKDVLLYKDGAKIGRKSMFRDGFPHEQCCINEHVFILRTNERCTQNYLYFWLDTPEMTQNIINLNTNAAQPGINQTKVKGLPVILPNQGLLDLFEQTCDPLVAEIFNFAKRNANLRQTRDLLLPKLISGEIDVSELEIETGTEE